MLKIILILVPSLQNCSTNFCNFISVNLENLPMKNNLKYRIVSLVLLSSVSLGLFMMFLLKYLLTKLSINLGGYSLFFCKTTFSFSRSKLRNTQTFPTEAGSYEKLSNARRQICDKWFADL